MITIAKTIGYIAILVMLAALARYLLSPGLQDNRPAADAVRTDLQSAGQHAAGAVTELSRAAETQRQLEATSNRLAEIQRQFEELNRKDAERAIRNQVILDEGKSILRDIRQNGAIRDQKP